MKSKILILAMLITFFANAQKVVRYMFVRDTIVNFAGKDKKAALTDKFRCQH
jgi:hypothetical protein